MGFSIVDVQEYPAKGFPGLDPRGLETAKVFDVAPLVAAKRGAEFEQDESLPADEAHLEMTTVFTGVEFQPVSVGKQREVEPMQAGCAIEPILIEAQFYGDSCGSILDRIR